MKLLVVEDEPKTGKYPRRGLSEAGVVVDLTRDGDERLLLATSVEYALVVLDVMLPGLDGWTVLQQSRETASSRAVVRKARSLHPHHGAQFIGQGGSVLRGKRACW